MDSFVWSRVHFYKMETITWNGKTRRGNAVYNPISNVKSKTYLQKDKSKERPVNIFIRLFQD